MTPEHFQNGVPIVTEAFKAIHSAFFLATPPPTHTTHNTQHTHTTTTHHSPLTTTPQGTPIKIARFHNIFGPMGTWAGGKEKVGPAAALTARAHTHTDPPTPLWACTALEAHLPVPPVPPTPPRTFPYHRPVITAPRPDGPDLSAQGTLNTRGIWVNRGLRSSSVPVPPVAFRVGPNTGVQPLPLGEAGVLGPQSPLVPYLSR